MGQSNQLRLLKLISLNLKFNSSRRGHIDKLYKHAPRRVREESFGVHIVNEWNNLPSKVVGWSKLRILISSSPTWIPTGTPGSI